MIKEEMRAEKSKSRNKEGDEESSAIIVGGRQMNWRKGRCRRITSGWGKEKGTDSEKKMEEGVRMKGRGIDACFIHSLLTLL